MLAHFFFALIPWWLYVVIGVAAALVVIMEVPTRLGLALGLSLAVAFCSLGFFTKGYHSGSAEEDIWWAAQAKTEHERLEAGFQAQLQAETLRADAALQENTVLRQEKQDAIDSAPSAPGDPIVIPALMAAKLYLIGHPPEAAGSKKPGATGHPVSPPKIPRLLLPSNQPTGTG